MHVRSFAITVLLLLGTFCFIDPPMLPQESMDVDVAIAKDLSVKLNVTLSNAVSESPP